MRKLIYASLIMAMGIALGACAERHPTESGEAQATASPAPSSTPKVTATVPVPIASAPAPTASPTQQPTATQPPTQQPPATQPPKPPASSEKPPFAIDAIRNFLASQMKLTGEQVALISWQPVTWRDSCLGVHRPKEMCMTVITPGFSLKFQTGTTTAVVNTDATGNNFRLAEKPESPGPLPALSWMRSGGFAGICQSLSVYSTGTYWLRNCKTDKVLAQGVLPEGQLTYLNELFERYASFVWQPMPPAGSADMFNDQIMFYGSGSQAITEAEQQKLNEYLAGLVEEISK